MPNTVHFGPRFLSREQAAKYLGVSVDVFDQEVSSGVWPAPRRRGASGRRLTWDKILLDATADQAGNLEAPASEGATAGFDHEENRWMERISNGNRQAEKRRA